MMNCYWTTFLFLLCCHVGNASNRFYNIKCEEKLLEDRKRVPDEAFNQSSAFGVNYMGYAARESYDRENEQYAWCPSREVGKEKREFIEIDLGSLRVITHIWTKGRTARGTGAESTPYYFLNYKREAHEDWRRYKLEDKTIGEKLRGNLDPSVEGITEMIPRIIARYLLFYPYNEAPPRRVCMKLQVYGCDYTEPTVEYRFSQALGQTSMEMSEITADPQYDGVSGPNINLGVSSVFPTFYGGLGRLCDNHTSVSSDNNLLNLHKSPQISSSSSLSEVNLERAQLFLSWSTTLSRFGGPSKYVDIVFRFFALHNVTQIHIHAANGGRDIPYSRLPSVIEAWVGGNEIAEAPYWVNPTTTRVPKPMTRRQVLNDNRSVNPRWIDIPVLSGHGAVGNFSRLRMYFREESAWISVSEVSFTAEIGNFSLVSQLNQENEEVSQKEPVPIGKSSPISRNTSSGGSIDSINVTKPTPAYKNKLEPVHSHTILIVSIISVSLMIVVLTLIIVVCAQRLRKHHVHKKKLLNRLHTEDHHSRPSTTTVLPPPPPGSGAYGLISSPNGLPPTQQHFLMTDAIGRGTLSVNNAYLPVPNYMLPPYPPLPSNYALSSQAPNKSGDFSAFKTPYLSPTPNGFLMNFPASENSNYNSLRTCRTTNADVTGSDTDSNCYSHPRGGTPPPYFTCSDPMILSSYPSMPPPPVSTDLRPPPLPHVSEYARSPLLPTTEDFTLSKQMGNRMLASSMGITNFSSTRKEDSSEAATCKRSSLSHKDRRNLAPTLRDPMGTLPNLPSLVNDANDETHVSRQGVCGTNRLLISKNNQEKPFVNTARWKKDQIELVKIIGEGNFGNVALSKMKVASSGGILETSTVGNQLVYTVRIHHSAPEDKKREFTEECQLLCRLCHDNIVSVLGLVFDDDKQHGTVSLLTMAYSPHGDLDGFLKKLLATSNQLSQSTLIYLATQIANGMKYLESNHIVHSDLACRNCHVGDYFSIKIGNIAIGQAKYKDDYYSLSGNLSHLLPIRWLPWESLLQGEFTSKSDVWSFAVTLWEILSYCQEKPHCQLNNQEVVDNARYLCICDSRAMLLPPPVGCPRELYDLMTQCWARVRDDRPKFQEIHMFLQRKNQGFQSSAVNYKDLMAVDLT